tara:strand:- start:349 stop:510 length:162 start_codon:yes stop_codon:yes gene_type:complete
MTTFFDNSELKEKFIVFSDPLQFVDDYNYACIIADDIYNKTGTIVAVEAVTCH